MVIFRGFDTDKDVPDLSGKVIVLTGGTSSPHPSPSFPTDRYGLGTSGVGKTAIEHLAKHNPSHIYFTGRNVPSADALIASCPDPSHLTFVQVDLTSLDSVRAAAERILTDTDRLDILIANAGIMATPLGQTKDGYEIQFGTNHVGNAALALRLLPLMKRTAELSESDVRFVAVTSLGARSASSIDFGTIKTTQEDLRFGTWGRYGQSKLANVLFARELARRYPQITSLAIHPGVVNTRLVTNLGFWKWLFVRAANPGGLITPEEGGVNSVWAATGRGVRRKCDGQRRVAFFEPVGKAYAGHAACFDEGLMKRLWEWTEKEVGVKAP